MQRNTIKRTDKEKTKIKKYNKRKNQSIEKYLKMTQMLELASEDCLKKKKKAIIH